ncbi:hypothetical protein [Ornithinibacillus contaminans]|uniref:hypothetical protein n=1 Tax=Ornithinibacillus contaminans TaxID=694055 RepID=UPI00064E121C|nr:hypothetical protein [Ornithinibacillus contaminans]
MNSLHGTVRLVSEGLLYFFGKFMLLYITIPLTLMWLLIGFTFGIGEDVIASISGPAYFFIAFFSIIGYKSLYSTAIAFGSTRIQLLKMCYGVGILAVVLSMLSINVLQLIVRTAYEHWDVGARILHPGLFLGQDYNFFTYLWMDIMVGFFLFGVPFLLYSINFRLGMQKSIIILMVLALIIMFLHYGSFLSNAVEWFVGLDFDALGMTLISLLGLVGLVALLLTYPIMRNAPLRAKSSKE